MRIDRRVTLLGVMLVVLSTIMATQYATTQVGYSYTLVHPTDADIRFIGCDNSSDDDYRVIRVQNLQNSSNATLEIKLGNISSNYNKTYTAAFGIVNEEPFAVNITHVTVTGANNYMRIWLHGNGSKLATSDNTAVFVYNNGTSVLTDADSTAWRLGVGDNDKSTLCSDPSAGAAYTFTTDWDGTAHVRKFTSTAAQYADAHGIGQTGRTVTNASDFVWIQVSVAPPQYGATGGAKTGTITFNFKSSTVWG